jgi:hypothetical protein
LERGGNSEKMVFTRPQGKAAFKHVLDSDLGRDDESPRKQAVVAQNIDDIFSLMSIDVATIDFLVYDRSATETRVPVVRGDKNLVRVLFSYVAYRYARLNGNPLSDGGDWGAITQEDYDAYRVSHYLSLREEIFVAMTYASFLVIWSHRFMKT